MKVRFLLVIVAYVGLLTQAVYGQNLRDEDGKKHGKWVVKGVDRPKSGFASNAIIEEGTYHHGRKTGVWIKYNKDGKTVKLKGNYVNNRPNGNYTRYFSNGKIIHCHCLFYPLVDQHRGIQFKFWIVSSKRAFVIWTHAVVIRTTNLPSIYAKKSMEATHIVFCRRIFIVDIHQFNHQFTPTYFV
jgi:hypothetical protein